MRTILCFGEIMMRLNPRGYKRILQADELEVSFAGGEANVAASLSNLGMDAFFMTKLPQNELGQAARNYLRRYGVDTSRILWGGPRLGVYYVEKGASQRPSKVIYDRAGSSIQTAKREEFDWGQILEGVDWFHFTGITPALGGDMPEICRDAIKACRSRKIKVSCDLNFRRKLWSRVEARQVMSGLVTDIDLLIANETDADDVFGIKALGTHVESGIVDKSAYEEVARCLVERFGIKAVAITLRTSISASVNRWEGMLYESGKVFYSPEYLIQIVDRVGSGDSFGAGLIYALLGEYDSQSAIDFAVAASCLKHAVEHDFNLVSIDEIRSLMAGNASGRVQR